MPLPSSDDEILVLVIVLLWPGFFFVLALPTLRLHLAFRHAILQRLTSAACGIVVGMARGLVIPALLCLPVTAPASQAQPESECLGVCSMYCTLSWLLHVLADNSAISFDASATAEWLTLLLVASVACEL